MLKNLSKPVVFTGSQIPMRKLYVSDAKKNLSDAIRFACEEIRGVYVVFDGIVINGTHAMKVKTRNADAFKSINYPVIAHISMEE
ncbi:MAG: asparaginase domain-containing protein [Lachnospira eligens]